jgi:folate-dependent tRNA-U54 methylase TrmFO/GidA
MKANFGILPQLTLDKRVGKRERGQLYADRAALTLHNYMDEKHD